MEFGFNYIMNYPLKNDLNYSSAKTYICLPKGFGGGKQLKQVNQH